MTSCILERSAETELDLRCLSLSSLLDDEYFATQPMLALPSQSTSRAENEDELYTSFEQAISERVTRISRQLSELPLATHSRPLTSETQPLATCGDSLPHQPLWSARQRILALSCLSLSLVLAGFDLMGLLVMAR